MNEKAYKTMSFAGAAGIATGIVMIAVAIAAGVIMIVSGARLLKDKKGLTFQPGLKGCYIFEYEKQKKNPHNRENIICILYRVSRLFSLII